MKTIRKFVDQQLKIVNWDSIKTYFENLETRELNNSTAIQSWLQNRSELEAVLEEELAWRYIRMNCDTENKEWSDAFELFVSQIDPEISKFTNILNAKFTQAIEKHPLTDKKYFTMLRAIKKEMQIFRKKNIPIFAQLQTEEQKYGAIAAKMTIDHNGEELTLHAAANFLKDLDRNVRQTVYQKINDRRLQDSKKLHNLLDKLIQKRHQVARNADFDNFADYKFQAMGRFDYTQKDCYDFHQAISENVKPLVEKTHKHRKQKLQLDTLKPWDTEVDTELKPALQPFKNSEELIDKTIQCFRRVRPLYGDFLQEMKDNKYLDLDARKGKAPGGFNYPLHESNIPFIYMNSTGNLRDLETIVHEGGHAVHAFLSADLELVNFKETPSEVAELASMSMELISMEHWDVFFDNPADLKRAKIHQLEGVIAVLPWVATVDKFQHWLYQIPNHTPQQRDEAWATIEAQFGSSEIQWGEQEAFRRNAWQRQLHIFEVPFYYIEYGISQLGAIAVWRNYKNNPQKALDQYESALKLGYTKTIPEIYQTAGIEFNFSTAYINDLMTFVELELNKLYAS